MTEATVLKERAKRLYKEAKEIRQKVEALEPLRAQMMRRHRLFKEKLQDFEREWEE